MFQSGSAASILRTLLLAPDLNGRRESKQRGTWFHPRGDHLGGLRPSLAFQGLKTGFAGRERQGAGALRPRPFPEAGCLLAPGPGDAL